MPRVKRGVTAHRRHKSVLEQAKGFRNGRRTQIKRAREAIMHAGAYAYRDRRNKKRDLRRAWIVRINAVARENGMTYSTLMFAMKENNIGLNRKVMSDMAITNPDALQAIIKSLAK